MRPVRGPTGHDALKALRVSLVALAVMACSASVALAQEGRGAVPLSGRGAAPLAGLESPGGMGQGLMPSPGAPMPTVQKITDGELSCPDLYREVMALEQRQPALQQELAAASQAASEASAALAAPSMASRGGGLLGGMASMIPLVGGMVSGIASAASASAASASFNEAMAAMTAAQQRMADVQVQLGWVGARHAHLTDLFLKRPCKVSDVRGSAANPP